MTMVQEPIHDFSELEPSGWDQGDLAGTAVVESDGTAPLSPSGVVKETIPAGTTSDQGVYFERILTSGKRYLQFVGAVKWSSAYVGHSSGNNKLIQIYSNTAAPHNDTIFEFFGDGITNNGTDFYPGFILQGGEDMQLVGDIAIQRNIWVIFKGWVSSNTIGNANGALALWIWDGSAWVESLNETGLRIVADGGANALHNNVVLGSYFGGGPSTPLSVDQYCYWDHMDIQIADATSEFTDPVSAGGGDAFGGAFYHHLRNLGLR